MNRQDGDSMRDEAPLPMGLRRKLVPRKRPEPDLSASLPCTQPMERALTRASASACGLHARAKAAPLRKATLSEMLDMIDAGAFLATLADQKQAEPSVGLICMDQSLFSALVEQRATGRLSATPAQSRPPTPTDAALLSDVIDMLMAFLAEEMLRQQQGRNAAGQAGPASDSAGSAALTWRLNRFVGNARLLEALLDEGVYDLRAVVATLSAGDTSRDGTLFVALPQKPQNTGAAAVAPPAETEAWQARFAATVMQAPAELRAVLSRVSMPLSKALELAPGATVTLPLSALEEVRVEARDTRLLARGRLGQYRGVRALRLTGLCDDMDQPAEPVLPALTAPNSPRAGGTEPEPGSGGGSATPPRGHAKGTTGTPGAT